MYYVSKCWNQVPWMRCLHINTNTKESLLSGSLVNLNPQRKGEVHQQLLVNKGKVVIFSIIIRSSSFHLQMHDDAHQHDDEQEIVENGDGFLPLKDLNQLPSTTMW